jgi:hypothetical protein
MKLYRSRVFKSAVPLDTGRPSHFVAPEVIQAALKNVCDAWVNYLQDYVDQTNNLFGKPVLPWKGTERAMVSSLAASVTRSFPNSLVVEEGRVTRRVSKGRSDLWASIPRPTRAANRFSFYLEAKKSGRSIRTKALLAFLRSPMGVSLLYGDYGKSHRHPLSKLSPYARLRNREHQHYVICMLVTRLKAAPTDIPEITAILHQVFENKQLITLRNSGEGKLQKRRRGLERLPTVAVVVLPDDGQSGMIASFTAFGSTSELLTKQQLDR